MRTQWQQFITKTLKFTEEDNENISFSNEIIACQLFASTIAFLEHQAHKCHSHRGKTESGPMMSPTHNVSTVFNVNH